MITPQGLCKEERLHGRDNVDSLFKGGASFMAYPFKCVYRIPEEDEKLLRVVVSVGKRYHKRAVKRNIIKRRAKEAFRLNKKLFYDVASISVDLALIYVGKKEETYDVIAHGVTKAIKTVISLSLESGDSVAVVAGEVLPTGNLATLPSGL